MNTLPIGVFDSGIGGLTVLAALSRALPHEDLLYLGDTARVPYGTRSPETVTRYSARVASHLYRRGVKALVIACNTATTHALPTLTAAGAAVGVPVIGVVKPGVDEADRLSRGRHVAILGTEGTVRAGRYQAALEARGLRAEGVACPLFVSLAEEGWIEGDVPRLVAERYLGGLRGGPDTVILGCTHFPLLRPIIQAVLPGVTLIDSAEATAVATAKALGEAGLLRGDEGPGRRDFLVTDNLERFITVGRTFLGQPPEPAMLVDLDEAVGPFHEPPAR